MSQSKLSSVSEVCLNTASGFIISMIVWRFIAAPYLDVPIDMETNLVITCLFTVTSLARGYVWRRVFNKAEK